MAKKVFTDESLATFVDEIKLYTDEAVDNHEHNSLYDAKGSANTALENAKTYADNAVAQKAQVQIITWGADD